MTTELRWTTADLDVLPDDGKRYEIIDGELFVTTQPHWRHQFICTRLGRLLDEWSERTDAGLTLAAPGVIFAEDDAVAPDLVWVRRDRLAAVLDEDGKLYAAPDLIVEVLSPGTTNERRDREAKLKLYSSRGVQEYWIVSWQQRQVEVYRRQQAVLRLIATLYEQDELASPLLSGFSCRVEQLFATIS
ncbi:MAG: Uma2 family endonuclease [Roseiflexaceae bacterium]